jgi:zinc protease
MMKNKTKISEFRLQNGLQILVKENHRSPMAVFQILYKVGSSFEINGHTGLSHALEHMMFRGTKTHPASEFNQIVAKYGGEQNAFTTLDYTTYYEIMPVEKIATLFKYEADRMTELSLSAPSFNKEIQVIREERRLTVENNPVRFAIERLQSIAHITSPYRHPVIGWMQDLHTMTIEDLRDWYYQWYTPNNAIIVVVGDVTPDSILFLAKKYFENIKAKPLPTIPSPKEITPLGLRTVTMKIPAKVPYIILGYNVPVWLTVKNKSEIYALYLLCEILAGGNTSHFQSHLLRKQQLIMDVNFSYQPFRRLETLLSFTFIPNPDREREEVQSAIFQEIERIKNNPPSEDELERIKVQMLADEIYQQDALAYQAMEISRFMGVGISWKWIKKSYQAMQKITVEEVQSVAIKYLNKDALTILTIDPLSEGSL